MFSISLCVVLALVLVSGTVCSFKKVVRQNTDAVNHSSDVIAKNTQAVDSSTTGMTLRVPALKGVQELEQPMRQVAALDPTLRSVAALDQPMSRVAALDPSMRALAKYTNTLDGAGWNRAQPRGHRVARRPHAARRRPAYQYG